MPMQRKRSQRYHSWLLIQRWTANRERWHRCKEHLQRLRWLSPKLKTASTPAKNSQHQNGHLVEMADWIDLAGNPSEVYESLEHELLAFETDNELLNITNRFYLTKSLFLQDDERFSWGNYLYPLPIAAFSWFLDRFHFPFLHLVYWLQILNVIKISTYPNNGIIPKLIQMWKNLSMTNPSSLSVRARIDHSALCPYPPRRLCKERLEDFLDFWSWSHMRASMKMKHLKNKWRCPKTAFVSIGWETNTNHLGFFSSQMFNCRIEGYSIFNSFRRSRGMPPPATFAHTDIDRSTSKFWDTFIWYNLPIRS